MPGAGRGAYGNIRSILESPILDAHRWGKVPAIPADAVLLDMEDSVPSAAKDEARDEVMRWLANPEALGRKLALPRCNSLRSPWGEDDLRALGVARAPVVVYPKLHDLAELTDARALLNASGSDPDMFVIVETAQAVVELESIARSEKVAALMFGPADLGEDAGFELAEKPAYHYPRSKIVLCGAAYGLPAFDMVFVDDLRDLDAVRNCAMSARRQGFRGMATFYPPHVEVINDVFTPGEQEVLAARKVVDAYEEALEAGQAAVSIDGRALIVQDYKNALQVLARAPRDPGSG